MRHTNTVHSFIAFTNNLANDSSFPSPPIATYLWQSSAKVTEAFKIIIKIRNRLTAQHQEMQMGGDERDSSEIYQQLLNELKMKIQLLLDVVPASRVKKKQKKPEKLVEKTSPKILSRSLSETPVKKRLEENNKNNKRTFDEEEAPSPHRMKRARTLMLEDWTLSELPDSTPTTGPNSPKQLQRTNTTMQAV